MNRAVVATLGIAAVAAATAGCSSGQETPAAPKSTTAAASSTVAPSATTPTATTPAATSSAPVTTSPASPTTTSTSTSTSTSPMVGGMTECTKEALAEPATTAAQELGPNNRYTIDTLTCADGWAVTSGLLSSSDNPDMGAPTSFIFEQEGQFWVPKDKARVCGTNPVTTTAPSDAEIPADLFVAGCAAG